MTRRAVAAAVSLALLAGACGDEGGTAATGPAPVTWTSDLHRLAVDHPADWRVAAARVTPADTDTFEVVSLATFDAPTGDSRCNPVPLAALEQMGPADALLVLREMVPGWFEDEPLPPLGVTREVPDRPGCPPAGLDVRAWERDVLDEPSGRRFRAYVAAGAEAPETTIAQAWGIVDGLRVQPVPGPEDEVPVGVPVRHFVNAHCGIRSTTFDGREWLADPPQDDGQGNPPPGWDDPAGLGTMVLESEDRAVYRTGTGRTAEFRPRTPADPPEQPCD